jgi:hypothetical protein
MQHFFVLRRHIRTGSPIHKFQGHKASTLCVQACRDHFLLLFSLYVDVVASYDAFGYLFFVILSFEFQWLHDRASVLAISTGDGFLNVWDCEKVIIHIHRTMSFS